MIPIESAQSTTRTVSWKNLLTAFFNLRTAPPTMATATATATAAFLLLLPLLLAFPTTFAFSVKSSGQGIKTAAKPTNDVITSTFSRNIEVDSRPVEETWQQKLERLWNDPRPVNEALQSVDDRTAEGHFTAETLPYQLTTGKFSVANQMFEVILYPRGILDSASAGSAAAYLRYHPVIDGDEIDVSWTLRLIDGQTGRSLSLLTSGGLPRSADTWSCAMTFTSRAEGVDSVGRTADWGSSTWLTSSIVDSLVEPGCHLQVEGNITVHDIRREERSIGWPLGTKGALGATLQAVRGAREAPRSFRSGEVIVPTASLFHQDEETCQILEEAGIYPGVDYRVMTISDADGNKVFSTDSLSTPEKRESAKLALRPVGWKLHQQMWLRKKKKLSDWPVEVEVGRLSPSAGCLSRFSPGAFLPRLKSLLARDALTVVLSLMLAMAPIPLTLLGRQFISLYNIPSASMEPTFLKGDVLLVEKFPGAFDRARRGDVVLFYPPQSLQDIIGARAGTSGQNMKRSGFGSNPLGSQSLFVKRLVGMPGDVGIKMDDRTKEVTVNGKPAEGPRRDLCNDEPLKLINGFLENGQGRDIDQLTENEAYVLGDCKAVSVDSRVFGTLPIENIVGRPVARTWPLDRFHLGRL